MILSSWAVVVAAGCALVACSDTSAQTADGPPVVVATTSIWADITSNVLCGTPVRALVPRGADPHAFEPSLRDRELIERADVVVANGSGLEGSLADLLSAAPGQLIEMTQVVATVDDDPHIWQDPTLVAAGLGAVTQATNSLGMVDCADDYVVELESLDAEITALLAPIPRADRIMVTGHDSLRYFADRYDIEVVGTVIPSTDTFAATNAAGLAALAEVIDERGVRSIFTERLASTADADALAGRLGVSVVPLVTDALTDDPSTDTYVEMMRHNATEIGMALAP